ncbi:DUF1127 domain-containing protein [Oceanibium sediminis]|uniref:DUF1127 domain-containing protein n=1 Tax=Oceanibium sediminis TaxID=2026339 RepID=UPI000DD4897F|nr:DUF1127 domain-containing protein [Oceanibium sediminis]
MAYCNTPRPAPFGALTTYSGMRFAERAVTSLRRLLSKSRTEAALARMSERELADVGLTRTAEGLKAVRYSPFSARV